MKLFSSPETGERVVATVVVIAFGAACALLLLHPVQETALTTTMLGVLAAKFGDVVGYYLGSSASSARKTEQISHLIGQAGAKPAAQPPEA